jgi:hypothetical protein
MTVAWLVADALQPASYSPLRQTVSVLAGHAGAGRGIVAGALSPIGGLPFLTAAGLTGVSGRARTLLIRWLEDDGWACAFAGCAVLAILALAWGIPGLARARVSACGRHGWHARQAWAPRSSSAAIPFKLFRAGRFAPGTWLFYLALPASLARAARPAAPRARSAVRSLALARM